MNYTRDNEKKDKDGAVIREAGSFQVSIHETFEETFTKYTQKSLDSLDTDGDYQRIYRSLKIALDKLDDKSFLEEWNTKYAAKLLSIGNAQLDTRLTISDMLNTDDYQKIADGLSVLQDATFLPEWEAQYANKVIISLSEALPKIDKLEDMGSLVEQAKEVISYLPDPESITYKPWKKFTYLESASATYTVTTLHQHNIYKNLSMKMKKATSAEEVTTLASTVNEEPYKEILSFSDYSKLRREYPQRLYQLGRDAILKNLENASPQQTYNLEDRKKFVATIDQYKTLLSQQSIHNATNSGNNPASLSMYGAYAYASDYRYSLGIYADYVDMMFQMQKAQDTMELQQAVITGREIFPLFSKITFDFHVNVNVERPHIQMETECILYYCVKLLSLAVEAIEKTDSLDELGAHYEHTQALLNRLDILFYPESKAERPVPYIASTQSQDLLSQFKEICLTRQDKIIEKNQVETKDKRNNSA